MSILFLETTTELIGTKLDSNVTWVVFSIVCDCHSIWKLMAPGANYVIYVYDFSEYSILLRCHVFDEMFLT